jgi:hypothetical protein
MGRQLRSIERGKMSLKEMKQHPMWHPLTDKQKLFIETYISTNGDRAAACNKAYDINPKYAEDYAARLLRQASINGILAMYYGCPILTGKVTRKEFIELLSRQLRDPRIGPTVFAKLGELYSVISGWSGKTKAGDEFVNDVVKQLEKKQDST